MREFCGTSGWILPGTFDGESGSQILLNCVSISNLKGEHNPKFCNAGTPNFELFYVYLFPNWGGGRSNLVRKFVLKNIKNNPK